MAVKIYGSGDKYTKVYINNEEVDWESCSININEWESSVSVWTKDGKWFEDEPIESIVLHGIHMFLSNGTFEDSQLILNNTRINGVKQVSITLTRDDIADMWINLKLLPNIVC